MEKRKPDLTRTKVAKEEEAEQAAEQEGSAISAGPVAKIIELAFNATREKMREVTIIDRMQGRLLPLLDLMNQMWQYAIEVALFRQDALEYARAYKRTRPIEPNLIDEFIYRVAQWQKSVGGKNLERAIDLALADMETKAGEDDDYPGGKVPWGDE